LIHRRGRWRFNTSCLSTGESICQSWIRSDVRKTHEDVSNQTGDTHTKSFFEIECNGIWLTESNPRDIYINICKIVHFRLPRHKIPSGGRPHGSKLLFKPLALYAKQISVCFRTLQIFNHPLGLSWLGRSL
jgi:hypothetical protein